MNKLGEVNITYIIAGIIAFFILIMVFLSLTGNFGKLNTIINYLPGFEQQIPEGTSIIGLNLGENTLEYYVAGDKWTKIKLSEPFFVLGNYEFSPTEVKDNLYDFYLRTERRPSSLSLSINQWRYWNVMIGDNYENLLKITGFTKSGFLGPRSEGTLSLNYLTIIKGGIDESLRRVYSPLFIEHELSSPVFGNAISWRDQILEGNSCEKFLTLNIKQDGVSSIKQYSVRKIDEYLLIDLSKPVEGRAEKWTNSSCFEIEQYKEEPKQTIALTVQVKFYDSFLKKDLVFTFDPERGWNLPDTRYETGALFWKDTKYRYSINGANTGSFHLGLAEILKTGGTDISSLVVGFGNPENLDLVYEKQSFSKLDIDNRGVILYNILNEYNKVSGGELT